MSKRIAFFDFDGTITTSDSLLEFIKFTRGSKGFYSGFIVKGPFLIAYLLGMVSNQQAKEKILTHFFKGMPLPAFDDLCRKFGREVLPRIIRPAALHEIEKLKSLGFEIVVVSASPENWISDWANEQDIDLIASRLEISEGKLTGRLNGCNCHGEEKVKRILQKHSVKDYIEVYAYGDSRGDLPMLKLATNSFYRPFRT